MLLANYELRVYAPDALSQADADALLTLVNAKVNAFVEGLNDGLTKAYLTEI